MADESPKRREPVFRNIIQAGQVLQIVPMLGVLGLLIKLIFIAGATYTAFTNGLEAETKARLADILEMKREASEAETRLAVKIDTNAKIEAAQIEGLRGNILDMKDSVSQMRNSLAEIVKASTPIRR